MVHHSGLHLTHRSVEAVTTAANPLAVSGHPLLPHPHQCVLDPAHYPSPSDAHNLCPNLPNLAMAAEHNADPRVTKLPLAEGDPNSKATLWCVTGIGLNLRVITKDLNTEDMATIIPCMAV